MCPAQFFGSNKGHNVHVFTIIVLLKLDLTTIVTLLESLHRLIFNLGNCWIFFGMLPF